MTGINGTRSGIPDSFTRATRPANYTMEAQS